MTQTDYDTLFPGPTITKTGDGGDQGDPCKGPNPQAYCFTRGSGREHRGPDSGGTAVATCTRNRSYVSKDRLAHT